MKSTTTTKGPRLTIPTPRPAPPDRGTRGSVVGKYIPKPKLPHDRDQRVGGGR